MNEIFFYLFQHFFLSLSAFFLSLSACNECREEYRKPGYTHCMPHVYVDSQSV